MSADEMRATLQVVRQLRAKIIEGENVDPSVDCVQADEKT
jgi:hypothetical protein